MVPVDTTFRKSSCIVKEENLGGSLMHVLSGQGFIVSQVAVKGKVCVL